MRDLGWANEATRSLHANLVLGLRDVDQVPVGQLKVLRRRLDRRERLPRMLVEAVVRLVVRAQRRVRVRRRRLLALIEEKLVGARSLGHVGECRTM